MKNSPLFIYLASDHAGVELKQKCVSFLISKGHSVVDLGPQKEDGKVDYPNYSKILAHAMSSNKDALGIGICGSGIGISIGLNRFKGVRAALCCDEEQAKLARQHNNANVLCLGARPNSLNHHSKALSIVNAFLGASFEGGRHQKRIDLLDQIH